MPKTHVYEVFHTIEGLIVDSNEPVIMGDYTFYQFPRDQVAILKAYSHSTDKDNVDSIFFDFQDKMSIVSVKVQAESPEIAENLAESFLSRLENVFAFSLFRLYSATRGEQSPGT